MKKTALILLLITGLINAQEFTNEAKSITGVFEAKDKTKSEIFSSVNKWIAINYNSSKNVIQMNDLESGTIIIKGINEVQQKSSTKILCPNMKNIPEYSTVKYNHTIEINIKDNKYRVIYTLVNIASEKDYGYDDLNFRCVNLNGNIDTQVNEFNEVMEKFLKQGLIGEKKRELVKEANKESFKELNTNLEKEIKSTMVNIENSIVSVSNDGW
ncbi:protein of unknown function [Flavobacterium gillisiae]|uniref:DUF4468 domain-containing protein n=1 Tax=Flavobacterium gillisiae TaxID=150146 RepID=A0A1H4FII1_9FLAO|nr:DUF4468 domain-containing protein [Flavobacterium gillisiae]SEA96630.1 protein of unknown function [Flavobacterium gillisiae]